MAIPRFIRSNYNPAFSPDHLEPRMHNGLNATFGGHQERHNGTIKPTVSVAPIGWIVDKYHITIDWLPFCRFVFCLNQPLR